MTSRLAARVFGALFLVAAPLFGPLSGLAYAQTPDAYDVEALPAVAAPPAVAPSPAAPVPKRVSTGACVILKGEQIVDQQNCKALAAADDAAVNGSAAAGFANGITYVWPSGNRTIIGGADDEFSVNGNHAVPLPDSGRGLCLMVEKTGNTFCYKEGAKVKAAAAQPAIPPAIPAPVAAKRPANGTAVAGATMTAPAATATAPGDTLAEEIKLRKAAEDEVKSLKAEIARLNEVEEKRLAELAGQRRAAEAGEKKKSAEADAEKARVAAALKEIDDLKARCLGRDAIACERALALAREAFVTGSVDTAKVSELQQLHTLAIAPFGVQALSFLGGVPRSTWAASSIAAFLAMSLLLVMSRRRQPIVLHEDVMSMPSLDETPLPSLDPFALTPQESHAATPHSVEAVLSIPSHLPGRSAPPPIPAFASMPALFPAKEA